MVLSNKVADRALKVRMQRREGMRVSPRGRQWLVKQSQADHINSHECEASEWEFQAEKWSNLYLDIFTQYGECVERVNVAKLQKSRLKKMAAWTILKAVEMGRVGRCKRYLRDKLTQLVMGWMENWEEERCQRWLPNPCHEQLYE